MNINHFSGCQKKILKNDVAHIVKYIAIGLEKTALKTMSKNTELSAIMTELVFKKMDDECQRLCMKESNSVLRSTSSASLIQFKMKDVKEEILQNAPVLSSLLQQICTAKRSKSKRQTHINEIVVPTIASLILHSRCPEMSAFSYRLGLLLRHAGAGTLVRLLKLVLYVATSQTQITC